MRISGRLSIKVAILVLCLGIVPLIVISALLYDQRKNNVKEMVTGHLGSMTEEIGLDVERTIFSAFAHISTLAENPILKSDEASIEQKLYEMQKIQKFFQLFEDITLLNLNGNVLSSTAYDYRGDWEYKDWYRSAREGETAVSPVHGIVHPFSQIVVVTAPVSNETGRVSYVIAGQVNMERIWEITDRVRFGDTGFAFLVDNSGNLLAFPDKKQILYKIRPQSLREKILAVDEGILEFQDENGRARICVFQTMTGYRAYAGQGWRIGVLQDSGEAFALIGAIRRQFVLYIVFGLGFLSLLLILLNRNIVRPIQILVDATKKIAGGDLETQVDFKANDEIAHLGHSFNMMVAVLKISRGNLVTEKERLAVTLRSIGEGVIALNTNGTVSLVNKEAESLTGWTSDEAKGKRATDILRLAIDFPIAQVPREGEPLEIPPCRLTSRTGEERIINGNVNPVFDDDGDIVGAVIAFRDITEKQTLEEELLRDITRREQVEEALQKSHEELEEKVALRTEELSLANMRLHELDQLKTMFIASMSHELRTPLNSILGFSGVMLQGMAGELTAEQRRQLTMLNDSGRHLLDLINDIIDVSKIESGNLQPELSSFNVAELLREIINSFAIVVANKNLDITLHIPPEMMLKSDVRRVRQVLTNLVSNAVKFTSHGRVDVRGEVHNGKCVIAVRDTGRGIPGMELSKLFKPFSQIKVDGDGRHEGAGLGLYLSRNLARLLGGELSAESELGKGSEFIFKLPHA